MAIPYKSSPCHCEALPWQSRIKPRLVILRTQHEKTPLGGVFWCTRWGSSHAKLFFALGHACAYLSARAYLVPTRRYQRLALRATRPDLDGYPISLCSHFSGYKNAALFRRRWCTRWGSNPDSTASEAVMLSNYTTSTYYFLKSNYILLFFTSILQAFMV